jgi:hypothetical protein
MIENNLSTQNIEIINNLYPILIKYENISKFILKRDKKDIKNK